MLCNTAAAAVSVLSAAVVVGKGGGGSGTRSLEWSAASGVVHQRSYIGYVHVV